MRAGKQRDKSGHTAINKAPARDKKPPKLYRPSGSLPFPEVCGKTVADVYVTTEIDRSCVTLRFEDSTELVIEVEPCLSFVADYSDWKTGNKQVIKSWPSSSKPRKSSKRPLGLFRGQIWMAPDFDAPMKLVEDTGETGLAPANKSSPNKKTKVYKSGKNHPACGQK